MNENNQQRRSLIKRGLTLVTGFFFFSATRPILGKPPEKRPERFVRMGNGAQNCIEAKSLPLPVQEV
jgi:hypothetical protein